MLNTKRALVVFDLETTSADTKTARTVQIAMIRIEPDGTQIPYKTLINPGCPIPPESTEVHGITDADVAGAPTLAEVAVHINGWTCDADLAGHNGISFDLEILQRQFAEAGIELQGPEDQAFIDTLKLEQYLVPNTLSAIYARRTGRTLEGAHDAMEDVKATIDILQSQLRDLGDERSPREIEEMLRDGYADRQRKFKRAADGDLIFGFGKHKGRPLREVYSIDRGYVNWASENLGSEVKALIRATLQPGKQPT